MFKKNFAERVWDAIRFLRIGGLLLQVHHKSYLRRRGWFNSFSVKRSVDLKGAPIPWWSYGVIDFVEERLNKSMAVLEFGSGGSTTWLATRVDSVVSVENDLNWAKIVRSFVPSNAVVVELSVPGELKESDLPASNRSFDVLIVDALANRIDCATAGLPFLRPDGVVIWDNTDGRDWPEIKALMATHGFKEISFSGVAPQEVAEDRTTIFYRNENVFGI